MLQIDDGSPWKISASKQVKEGYETSFCVECTNGKQTILSDQLVVRQSHKCSTSLVKKSYVRTIYLTHLNTKSSTNIGVDWEEFFDNQDHYDCPINKCILKAGKDCSDTHTSKYISIQKKSPFYILATRDAIFGYEE